MARINFDDDVESQPEFRKLLSLCNGDWDVALGRLVRFFRIAQEAYGRSLSITKEKLESEGLVCMIESGWAIKTDGGYESKGSETHFSWYKQRILAGHKGGISQKTSIRTGSLDIVDESAEAGALPAKRDVVPAKPLALSPSLALSLSKRQLHVKSTYVDACALFFSIWNTNRGTLPEAKAMSKSRKRKALTRWNDKPDEEYWTNTVRRISNSGFCNGDGSSGWVATIDFILSPDAHLKINEGKYDNKENQAERKKQEFIKNTLKAIEGK